MLEACGQCVRRDRETNKKHGKDYVEEGLQLAKASLDRDGIVVSLLRWSRIEISLICFMAKGRNYMIHL